MLLSCSKKNDSNNKEEFYFIFKANGQLKNYSFTGSVFYNETDCVLGGSADNTSSNAILIDLSTDTKIKADTTYSETERLPAPRSYVPKCSLRLSDNYIDYNYFSIVGTPAGLNIYDCTVRIMELDANHVKGMFSGKVSNETNSAFISITEGEFNVKR